MVDKTRLMHLLPKKLHKHVNDEVVNIVNKMHEGTDVMQEYFEEMFEKHINVLSNIGAPTTRSITRYVNALKFVMLKQRMSVVKAWAIVFRDKYEKMLSEDRENTANANASAYARNSLVQEIEAQMLVDFSVFYGWARHEAMMKHIDLMRGKASPSLVPRYKTSPSGRKSVVRDDSGNPIYDKIYQPVSPNVQREAAKTVLEITAPEKENVLNIKFGLSDEAIQQQKQTEGAIRDLAIQMREALENGADITDVQVIGHVLTGSEKDDDDTE